MTSRRKEPQPPDKILLEEHMRYSKDILESMSRNAREIGQHTFADLLDRAAAEAARIMEEKTEASGRDTLLN